MYIRISYLAVKSNDVAIMRAFMNNPKIILADEPTASSDADRATKVV